MCEDQIQIQSLELQVFDVMRTVRHLISDPNVVTDRLLERSGQAAITGKTIHGG